MAIDFAVLKKAGIERSSTYRKVEQKAGALLAHLDAEATQLLIKERHVLGASSAGIQELVLQSALQLGFQDEKRGLFTEYEVSALRPDYYCAVNDTGVLLEVERGKTTTNNMDLLDLWKCHICSQARFLFLVVPQARPSANGRVLRHFSHVRKRLAPFFEGGNYVNVDAVFLYGY